MEHEVLSYLYICKECGKFKEETTKNDSLSCCDASMKLATPDEIIAKYKKKRRLFSILAFFFTVIFPISTIIGYTLTETQSEASYRLPFMAVLLIAVIVLRGRDYIDRVLGNFKGIFARNIILFFTKNILYLTIIAFNLMVIAYLEAIKGTLVTMIAMLGTVIAYNTLGYCVFEYKRAKADFYIKKALRQAETIQALEIAKG